MRSNFLLILALPFLINSCGFTKKKQSNKFIGPAGTIDLDLSKMDFSLTGGKNPVGVVTQNVANHNIEICTAFVISEYRVLTNYHCISYGNDQIALAKNLKLHFRNRGEDMNTVEVARVVSYEDNKMGTSKQKFSSIEENRDWALLETATSVASFGSFDIDKKFLPLEAFENDESLTMIRVNLETSLPPYKAQVVPTKMSGLAAYVDEDLLNEKTENMRKECKKESKPESNDLKHCDEINYSKNDVYKDLKSVQSIVVKSLIRQGNSGSPVLYKGQAVGIAFAGIWAQNADQNMDSSRAVFQMFSTVGDAIDQ